MGTTVVLYPGLDVSHFVPMMQLTDVLLEEGYAVTVALIDPSLNGDIALAAVVDRYASSKSSVTFHKLPRIENPPSITYDAQFLVGYLNLMSRYTQHLHDFLCSLPPGSVVRALIVDMMSTEVFDTIKNLGIPAYTFFPSNMSALAVSLQVSSVRAEGQPSFKELGDTALNFYGVPPMPASHLFEEMLESPESEIYKLVMNTLRRIQEAKGILVNTFASLEARAVAALRDKQCFPTTPPVYCVGPLVAGFGEEAREKHECLAWLGEQPERSVVFLCFGSRGTHTAEQLREIAVGLDKSGQRFLWAVRTPAGAADDLKNLDAFLPEGFLERTMDRGLIVRSWAPQLDVLCHPATGAFVTHCGWNSTLEAIAAGVPMLCWPLYAEQMFNKVLITEVMGVGVEIEGYMAGFIRAEEVEAKVRLVMESTEGRELRERVVARKNEAMAALGGGGSSQMSFARFLSDGERCR